MAVAAIQVALLFWLIGSAGESGQRGEVLAARINFGEAARLVLFVVSFAFMPDGAARRRRFPSYELRAWAGGGGWLLHMLWDADSLGNNYVWSCGLSVPSLCLKPIVRCGASCA